MRLALAVQAPRSFLSIVQDVEAKIYTVAFGLIRLRFLFKAVGILVAFLVAESALVSRLGLVMFFVIFPFEVLSFWTLRLFKKRV